jgi:pyruvate dehydrogenase E2 component (dihydrolipoamide acetyltransferase)
VATLLRVPEVAAGATEAVLSEWLVAENASFAAGDPIVVIETDKAVVEVPAEIDAVLLRRLVTGGTPVEVGAPIALLGDASDGDGDLDRLLAELGVAATPTTDADSRAPAFGSVHAAPEPETAPEPDVAGSAPAPQAAPALPQSTPAPTSPVPSAPSANGSGRVFASPLARRILAQAGLSTDGITGTGPGGRIVRRDAEAALQRASAEAGPPPAAGPTVTAPSPGPTSERGYRDVPHTRMRRAIAARLTASKQSIPHFYVKRTVRLDALLELRRGLNEVSPQKISVNDLLLKAVALAHVAVPDANAIWTDDAVRVFDSVDVAVAVASDRGLVTPVLRDVQGSTPSAIARQTREFVRLANEGKLAQTDLEGGSIAVTNLGMYGVEEFAAIINPPQSSILAVGAAVPAPVVVEGTVEVASVLTVVLSVDHRVIDGALAAHWMDTLVSIVEQPLRLLV